MNTSRTPHLLASLAVAALGPGLGCDAPTAIPAGAFSHPVDLAYACEGESHTVAPDNDEDPVVFADFDRSQMCGPITTSSGETQGYLLGMVLNQQPPGVVVVQMNPAARGGTRVLDTDLFIPGLTAIPVGDGPTQILTAPDWGAFYVVSAGSKELTHIVVGQIQDRTNVGVQTRRIPLPATPGAATIFSGHLIVASAHTPELWVLKTDGTEAVATIDLPGTVQEVGALGADLILTWTDRPVVSRWQIPEDLLTDGGALSTSDEALDEVGLVGPCMDSLDNDGDGDTDADDTDCRRPEDQERDQGLDIPDGDEPASFVPPDPSSCTDGLDNDRDGLTDDADPACLGEDPVGEHVPGCGDGLDGDGDGLVDLADPGCYGPDDLSERSVGGWGPARLAVVDGGVYGRFVYVLNQGLQEIAVFDATEDGRLDRIDVAAHEADVPDLLHVPYASMPSGETTELTGRTIASLPGPQLGGEMNLTLPNAVGGRITAGRLRGELWTRLITTTVTDPEGDKRPSVPLGLSSDTSRRPVGCDPGFLDTCVQPKGDDATWFVFLPRLDGRIQLIEAIRRGTPVHRHVQSTTDPEDRTASLPLRPTLSVAGTPVFLGTSPPAGHPFLGPMVRLEELAPGEPDVSPPLYRSYGVWLDEEPEQVGTEAWSVTYEGVLPHTTGHLARMVGDDRVHDPMGRFCERGVEAEDWFVLRTTREQVHADLWLPELSIETDAGDECATVPTTEVLIEVPVTSVGLTTLGLDLTGAHLRHPVPTLDAHENKAAGVSAAACSDALNTLLNSTGWMTPVSVKSEAFHAAAIPARFSYEIRPADTWIVEGSRSGFLHRWTWTVDPDSGEGSCGVDPGISSLATGRARTAELIVETYEQCPPTNADLALDAVDGLLATPQGFKNFSFSLDIFPGCDGSVDGAGKLMDEIRRDTRWSFQVEGPDNPRSVSGSDMQLAPRVPLLDFRRQQVQLDSGLGRLLLLEIRPGTSASLQSHF